MDNQTLLSRDLLKEIQQSAREREAQGMHPQGALSKDHRRYYDLEEDYRLPYKRDIDRIVHSKAYSRYVDKTQVVYLVENDHIAHRSLHVQLVSQFARGIGEILCLNTDLVEAIALGHDVGHPPFGHEGEGYLSNLSEAYGNGIFAHPLQSCRLFSAIENLNLGLAVYDGFLCHDGGMQHPQLTPRWGKTWDDHFGEKEQKLSDPEQNILPATLEGCLVKLCDTMSYIGRDIEDAISLGIIQRSQLPRTILGTTNGEILNFLASDLIANSYKQPYIALSQEAFEALKILREFNFQRIYTDPKLKRESAKIQRSYQILFELLLDDYDKKKQSSYMWKHYLHNKEERYLAQTAPVQMVIDFISGMTDSYFIRTFEKLVVPTRIDLA